jgi:riboflavin synthase
MKIGIADTTFARDTWADRPPTRSEARERGLERYVVPRIKSLPVRCKKLIEGRGATRDGLGSPPAIRTSGAHEASWASSSALKTNKHVIESRPRDKAKDAKELPAEEHGQRSTRERSPSRPPPKELEKLGRTSTAGFADSAPHAPYAKGEISYPVRHSHE